MTQGKVDLIRYLYGVQSIMFELGKLECHAAPASYSVKATPAPYTSHAPPQSR